MKKRILVCALLVVAMLLPMLSSCGFGGGDSLEIENITAELQDDGSTRITIQYFDDVEKPLVFEIPMGAMGEDGLKGEKGDQGEKGDTGNGIKSATITNTQEGEQTLTIVYTDEKFEDTVVTVKDGATIEKAERVDEIDENGVSVAKMKITFSDGREEKIALPKGDTGVGIDQISQIPDPNSNDLILTVIMTDGTTIGPFTVKPGVGLTGDVDVEYGVTRTVIEGDQEITRTGLLMKFKMENENYTTEVFVPYGQDGKDGVSFTKLLQEEIIDEDGNRIGVKFKFATEDGSQETDFVEVKDGISIQNITSSVNAATQETTVTVKLTNGDEIPFIIPASKGIGISRVEAIDNKDNSLYVLRIHYTQSLDPNNPSATYEDLVFHQNTAWHHDGAEPDDRGKVGDYFFDEKNLVIYRKISDSPAEWEVIADLSSFDKDVTIRFSIDPNEGESWTDGQSGNYKTRRLKVGTMFATSAYTIPVPQKAGYVFVGWYTTREPNPAIHGQFTDLTVIPNLPMSNQALELYPLWAPVA